MKKWYSSNIKNEILLWFFIVSILPLLFIFILYYFNLKSDYEQHAQKYLTQILNEKVKITNNYINNLKSQLETISLFPITKEQSIELGYSWYDDKERNYKITKMPGNLPDDIEDIKDEILSEVIGCEHVGKCNQQCTMAFRVTENELIFYRKMNIPIPSLCQNCRHYERLAKRNPMKLWHRKCMKEGCTNEFETSYAPDRPEIVYCEKCYQQEVY